ncbi:hypothetical protein JNUCC42_00165 [Brevibacterium sp. JNUCC-42]|nr:hypothetical protein JNUCC42_00165 [Brevibacterium sp. JNUCC-42]
MNNKVLKWIIGLALAVIVPTVAFMLRHYDRKGYYYTNRSINTYKNYNIDKNHSFILSVKGCFVVL